MILMHKQGWQIDDASLEHLLPANKSLVHVAEADTSASRSQSRSPSNDADAEEIYCFNRDHLDADPDELEAELTLTASSVLREPPITEYALQDPSNLAQAHLNASSNHLSSLKSLLYALTLQRAALGVALSNLDNHLKGKLGGFETFELFASPLLTSYDGLLKAYEPALDLLGKIQVHPNLVSATHPTPSNSRRQSSEDPSSSKGHARGASGGSNAPRPNHSRWLSDYVSKDKIAIVKDQCGSAYHDVQSKFTHLHTLLEEVHAGASHLRSEYESDNLDDLADCSRDSEEAHQRTKSLVDALANVDDEEHQADIFAELALLEREFRERILYLVARKNAATRTLLLFLQHIAALQSDLSQTPVLIRDVDSDLKKRCDNFKYLARLREMAPAYAATLAEIVRRRTYSQLVVTEASDMANMLSKFAESESKRRTQYRSESAGRLPWDIKGMEANPEHVELEVRRSQGQQQLKSQAEASLPEIARSDVEEFLTMLQGMMQEVYPADLDLGDGCMHPLKEAAEVLQRQLKQLDSLHAEFERLSAAMANDDSSSSSTTQDHAHRQQEIAHARQEEFQQARDEWQEEVARLQEDVEQLRTQLRTAQEDAEKTNTYARELEHKHASAEAQFASLKTIHSRQDNQLHTVQADLTVTSSELARAQAAHASAKATQLELQQQIKELIDAKSELEQQRSADQQTLKELTSTKNTLQSNIQQLQTDLDQSKSEASESQRKYIQEKQDSDKKVAAAEANVAELQQQTEQLKAANATLSEKERAFHAYKSEAEVDRASLEQQLSELRELQQTTAAELSESKFQYEQLEAQHAVMVRRQESEKKQGSYLPKVLGIANALAKHASEAMSVLVQSTPNLATNASTSETPPQIARILPEDFLTSLDRPLSEAEIENQLKTVEALSSQVSEAFPQAVNEHIKATRSTLLRWQKECKSYRQRERSKIAFQNFKEGDLALFLPTRNTTAQIWAAFNAGFPHYFLKATGQIADQIKTREWIVARINSLEERTADPQLPDGNPFSLGAGVKFWLLETEPWTPISPAKSRKSSGRIKNKSRSSGPENIMESALESPEKPNDLEPNGLHKLGIRSTSSLPQTPERKPTSNAASQTTKALDLATSTFSLITDPNLAGSSSPVFTNPDTPAVPQSNLTRAMSTQVDQKPQEDVLVGSAHAELDPSRLPLQAANDSLAPLSSSPQPAFLPMNHNRNQAAFPSGSISGRSKAGSYVGRRGVSVQMPPKDGASDQAESEDFTQASLGSAGKNNVPSRAARRAPSRRFSMASSSNLSSGGDKGPKGPSGRGSATLASSFVSSLGRTSARKEAAAVGSVENLNKSSPSVDLLRRFSQAVESSTGSPLPGSVPSQYK